MPDNNTELDQMQATYVAAVEQLIDAIGQEEALASVNHTIAEVDKWENATLPRRRNPQSREGRKAPVRRRIAQEILQSLKDKTPEWAASFCIAAL
ncbi:MAG: hypothetical protein WA702_18890 [Bradyrhizobium sp.]|uniref:hypothetical protein n=1 Tax=Bradyrhizobium sp. TaxID=376 RepID=UPI003C798ED5